MSHGHVLALVLAGGEGSRLRPLTETHAKPAVHFAGGYRLIDFVLANLVNSEIHEIYVLLQYKPHSLIQHIQAVWQRPYRHLAHRVRSVLPESSLVPGAFAGTADAVRRNLALIDRHRPDVVAVFAADHVYRMDVRQMLRFHSERDAEVTIGVNRIPREAAHRFGIVEVGPAGRIESFVEKPRWLPEADDNMPHALASMGNYLFAPQALIRLLEAAHDDGASDFGHHVVPRAVASTRAYAYDFATNHVPGTLRNEEQSYWRDVGTLEALEAARGDLLGPAPRFRLTNPRWPLHPSEIKPRDQRTSHEIGAPSGSHLHPTRASIDGRSGVVAGE